MMQKIKGIGQKLLGRGRRMNLIMLALLVLLAGIVGATYSFYTSDIAIKNNLITKGSEVLLMELFNPAEKWVAGETKEKRVSFGNQLDLDQLIRFTYEVKWYKNNGAGVNDVEWPSSTWVDANDAYRDSQAITLNWDSNFSAEWTAIPGEAGAPPTYYYNKVLKAMSNSTPTMTDHPTLISVTFSDKIANNAYFSGDDFSDKRVVITIKMEAIDVTQAAVEETWNMGFTRTGDNLAWTPLGP